MTEGSSKKRDHDFSVIAHRVVQEATGQAEPPQVEPELTPKERHAAAVALGRLGGKKGGKARAKKLSKERRSEIARNAAKARWGTVENEEIAQAALSQFNDDDASS